MIKRGLLITVILILTAISAIAQSGYTTVTATVQDSNGTKYVNSPFNVSFFDPGTSGKLPRLNGSTFQTSYSGYATDSSGNLSISLPDNSVIASSSGATNTQWRFSICTASGTFTTIYCIPAVLITISGTSQNITSNITAVAPFLPNGGGGGGTIPPGGINGNLQFNNAGTTFGGATGLTTPDGNQLYIKGPAPWADVTAFNARPYYFFGLSANNAAITTGTTSLTLTDPGFKNGDGITIWGAGPTWNGSSGAPPVPSTPVITPSIAAGGTMSGIVKTAANAASSYNYRLVGRDKFGGLTVASSAGTTAVGYSTLGLYTNTITTCSRSSATVTCNTSAANNLVIGSLVHIHGGSSADFTGWYTVSTVPSNTQFTIANTVIDTGGLGSTINDSSTNTGGTVAYYVSNHLTWAYNATIWEYYVCTQRPGDANYHLIGVTKPSVNGWQDTQFDDFGSPFMDSQSYPKYVEKATDTPNSNDAICTSVLSVPDPLTTIIASGAGTGTLTLAAAASNTVSSQTALYDAGPNIIAAANTIRPGGTTSAVGNLFFPPAGNGIQQWFYVINSYTVIPNGVNMILSAGIYTNETIEFSSNYEVYGNWAANNTPQFGFDPVSTGIQTPGTANPLIYTNGVGAFNYLALAVNTTNGGTGIISDNGGQYVMSHGSINTGGGSSDYISMNIVARSQGSGGNNYHYDYTVFSGGPDQIIDKTWTPLIYMPPNQNGSGGLFNNQGFNMNFFKSFFNRRGMEEELAGGNGGQKIFDNVYRQGGITPLLSVGNSVGQIGGYYYFHNIIQDTESAGTLSQWGSTSVIQVDASGLENSAADTNGTPPPFTGTHAGGYTVIGSRVGKLPSKYSIGLNGTTNCITSYPYIADCVFPFEVESPMRFTSNSELFWPLNPPSSISAVVAAGGSLTQPASYFYNVSSVDALGVESVIATTGSSACTTSAGNQTCNITYTKSLGTASVNIYRSPTGANGSWQQIQAAYTGAQPYADTLISHGTLQSPINSTGAFLAAMNANGIYSPQHVSPETTAPAGIGLFDQLYADSSAHRWKMINNNVAADTVIGAATTDTLTNKTLTAPVINGTSTGTGILTSTLKKGAGSVNYTTSSTSYVQVDAVNLLYTIVVPTGWKLVIQVSGTVSNTDSTTTTSVAIADGGTILQEVASAPAANNLADAFSLGWLVVGDGASHTIDLRFKTSNGTHAATIINSSTSAVPSMVFMLTPSN